MKELIEGIVIRTVDYKDADKIVTILTKNGGKITARANGARRKSSKIAPAVELFSHCSFTIFGGKSRNSIDDAEIFEQFFALSSDILKMALACYACEIALTIGEDDYTDSLPFDAVLAFLRRLSREKCDLSLAKSVFELKFAQISGYEPDLTETPPDTNGFYIDFEHGGVISTTSPPPLHSAYPLDQSALSAISFVLSHEPSKSYNFELAEPSRTLFSDFCTAYLHHKLGVHFKTHDFYRSLAN